MWKETIRRALRTFGQAALGYIAAKVVLLNWDDPGAVKASVVGLITAAIACGLAALMNLPPSEMYPEEEYEEQKGDTDNE